MRTFQTNKSLNISKSENFPFLKLTKFKKKGTIVVKFENKYTTSEKKENRKYENLKMMESVEKFRKFEKFRTLRNLGKSEIRLD